MIDQAFVNNEAHVQLGKAMAAFVYETAQRPGFMRTLDFHTKNHTVCEFTSQERLQVARIKRKHRQLMMVADRYLVRALRRQPYDGPKTMRRHYSIEPFVRPYTQA
jgi:hypothetical protein